MSPKDFASDLRAERALNRALVRRLVKAEEEWARTEARLKRRVHDLEAFIHSTLVENYGMRVAMRVRDDARSLEAA